MSKNMVLGIDKAHFAFYMAKDFFDQGVAATIEIHPPKFKFNTKNHWAICFPIVTLAFSLELALKLFLSEQQIKNDLIKKRQGHSLLSIYRLVGKDQKDAVENHFTVCKSHNYNFFNVVYKSGSTSLQRDTFFEAGKKIEDCLHHNGQPFLDFRYFYDFGASKVYSFDFNTVIKLIHSCLAIKAIQLDIDLN